MELKEQIRGFALSLGVDDVGFAATRDYHSPQSPSLDSIFPAARSMVIMVNREMSHCESPNSQIAMAGRIDAMEYARHCNFELARYLERQHHARAMSISPSYPLDMSPRTKGVVAEISLRHAAVAAGLGKFGRHNLVIHPRLGSRVLFCGVLCNLELSSDPPVEEDLCSECNLCVENCPAGALDEEGRTNTGRCLTVSQPYGLGSSIGFWRKFVDASPEEQKNMFLSESYWKTFHAQSLGFHYHCFRCYTSCPIGA